MESDFESDFLGDVELRPVSSRDVGNRGAMES